MNQLGEAVPENMDGLYVTEVRALSSSRVLVRLENGSAFPLYKKELSRYKIAEGEALDPETYTELFSEILPKRVKLRAMHLLQKMDRTRKQLRRNLEESGYTGSLADLAIDYVASYHYIDDVRFAFHYMDYRKDTHSMNVLRQELREKGVSDDDIQAAAEQVDFPDEAGQIGYWIRKKHFDRETADLKEKQRMIRFLMRKGFSLTEIIEQTG